MKSDHNISDHAHVAEQADVLECSCNSFMIDLLLCFSFQFFSVKEEGSCRRKINTGQHIEDRSLSRTIRTDHSVDLSFFDLDIRILNCFQSAEGDS